MFLASNNCSLSIQCMKQINQGCMQLGKSLSKLDIFYLTDKLSKWLTLAIQHKNQACNPSNCCYRWMEHIAQAGISIIYPILHLGIHILVSIKCIMFIIYCFRRFQLGIISITEFQIYPNMFLYRMAFTKFNLLTGKRIQGHIIGR